MTKTDERMTPRLCDRWQSLNTFLADMAPVLERNSRVPVSADEATGVARIRTLRPNPLGRSSQALTGPHTG